MVTVGGGVGQGLVLGKAHSSADYADGLNELAVQEAVRDSVGPGSVFYDVGANIGFFGLIAARIVGDKGSVYAFEPLPGIAAEVRANAQHNGFNNVHVIEAAASDRTGTASIFVTRHPGGATLSEADVGADLTGRLEVRTVRIDELVESGELRPPDAVKIDVEGVEAEVIEGMNTTLRLSRAVVVCELDAATPEAVQAKVDRLTVHLNELRYSVRTLPPSYSGSGWHVVHMLATPL